MINRSLAVGMLALTFALHAQDATAQKKPVKPKTKRSTVTTTGKASNKSSIDTSSVSLSASAVMPDTAKPKLPDADIKLNPGKMSLRNEFSFRRNDANLVKDRIPLEYEDIREEDAAYVQRVWREIDVHEKMNVSFNYKAQAENGDQRFIYLLLNAIKKEEITAFSAAMDDDRFTTPISFKEIAEILVGKPKVKQVTDWEKDPDGSKGFTKDTTIVQEFNPDIIERYWVKEEWIFDKESSRMHTRILGIAPIKTVLNEDGSVRGVQPAFWVYYPDLRPMLAKTEVYNGRNFGNRMSWEELFESRFFASRIIKASLNNPNDQFIEGYIKDPILRLLEGENIKEKIFSYEQDLWSY